MRIISLLLLGCLWLPLHAQKKNNLVVDVQVDQQPIRTIFTQIESQTKLLFSYNTSLINADSVVSYHANKALKKVISDLFHKRIQNKIIGQHIVLVKSKNTPKKKIIETILYQGIIVDAFTKKPLSQASIYEVRSRTTVLTDASGAFSLPLEKGQSTHLNIAKALFYDTLITIHSTRAESITILLKPHHDDIALRTRSVNDINLQDSTDLVLRLIPHETKIIALNLRDIHEKRLGQVSFVPSIGSHLSASGIIENTLSLNVLGGYNGGVNGIEIGGLFNVLNYDMTGVQIGGLSNLVGGVTHGVQIGGLLNKCKLGVTGVQIGGISNLVTDSVLGVQIGGISNYVGGTFNGLQIGGIHNHNVGSTHGMQLGGILNFTQDSLRGFQLAGISNTVNGEVHGFQLAGIHNLSTKNLTGAQISGISNQAIKKMNGLQISLVNYAHQNNGLQIGLINHADSATGIAIGLFNFVKDGYHPIEVYANDIFYTNLAFKSGSDYFYTTYFVGLRPDDPATFGVGMGLGTKINTWKWLSFSLDVSTSFINEKELVEGYTWEQNLLNRADLTVDFNIKKFTIFAGPALNVHVSKLGMESTGEYTSAIAQNPFHTEVVNGSQIQMWYGGKAGLRWSF